MDLQFSSKKFLKSIREKPRSFQRSTYTVMGSPQRIVYSSNTTSSHSQQLNEFPGVKFRKNTSPLDANDERKQLIFGTIRGLKRFKRHSDLSEIFGRKQQRTDIVSLCSPNLPKEYSIDPRPDDEASFNESQLVAPEIVQEVPKCKQSIRRLEGLEDLQQDSKLEVGNPLRDRHLSPYARTSSTMTTRSMYDDASFRARRRPFCQVSDIIRTHRILFLNRIQPKIR
ncbi:unnamed protein product, partial [Mesorhabditis belari]|uniref:Uncharacterized protein n=1 Tax=Mesorhabditis belari TaxID=2138241 RepID=A0AAF3ERB4_9BILA